MASDDTLLNSGTGGETIRSLGDAGGINWMGGWCAYPTTLSAGANVLQIVDLTHGLPVQPQTGSTFTVTGVGGTFPVTDSGGSLTVDNAALSVVGGGAEATALRVTIASDSTGVLSIDDNGGSITVDGTVAVSGSVAVTNSPLTTLGFALHEELANISSGSSTTAISINCRVTGTQTALIPTVESTGALWVSDAGGSLTVDGTVAATQSGTWNIGTVTTLTGITNVVHVDDNAGSLTIDNAALSVTGGGVEATALRVTIASDSTGVLSVDDNGGSLTVDGTVAATQSGTWTVQPGNTANTTPWLVTDTPATSGGLTPYSFISSAAVQAANIKASAGQVYGLQFFNTNAAARYVRLYNQTASPATTDTPIWRGIIPGNAAGSGFVSLIDKGIDFSTGIGIRVTAGAADNDNTALAASEVLGNVLYK